MRRLRAVVLIAVSLIAIGVVSAVWELPHLRQPPVASAEPVRAEPLETRPGEQVDFGFLGPKLGWAAATDAAANLWIFSTIDGAAHWKKVTEIPAMGFGPPQLHILNARDMWITAQTTTDGQAVLKSQDGGYTWTELLLPGSGASNVGFSDPKHGWAVAQGQPSRLYMTADGGLTWRRRPDLPVDFASAVFANPDEGWLNAVGPGFVVYRTANGGQTWDPVPLPAPPPGCPPKTGCQAGAFAGNPAATAPVPYFFSALITLFATGAVLVDATAQCTAAGCPDYGEAEFISFDHGASWTYVAPPFGPYAGYAGIAYGDDHDWWAITGNSLYKTLDSGRHWAVISDKVEYDHLTPHIIDANHAWAVQNIVDDSQSNRGRVFTAIELDMTADGGLTWKTVSVPVPG